MRISLFGNLRISFAGRPVTAVNTNRLHSLIAYLILHGDTPQPRERLAFLLWPASQRIAGADESAATSAPSETSIAGRMQFAGDRSISQFNGGRMHPVRSTSSISRRRLQRPLPHERRMIARGRSNPSQPRRELYEDDLLPALYDDWLTPLREEYRRRISEVLQRLATLFEEQKEYAAAIPWADRLVALDPL